MATLEQSRVKLSSADLSGACIGSSPVLARTVLTYLESLSDERREAILRFHTDNETLINRAKGSQTKHQAWVGGYIDHLAEIFRIADMSYEAFTKIRPVPFSLDSALIVLYFHDVEKIWKYTTGLPSGFDKEEFLYSTLKERYGIVFTREEQNALHFIHGEGHAGYDPLIRKAGPLAAFCHTADTLSARMWFDEGKGLGV